MTKNNRIKTVAINSTSDDPDQELLDRFERKTNDQKDVWADSYISAALMYNHLKTINTVFDHLQIPQMNSIKERICYYQLLEND